METSTRRQAANGIRPADAVASLAGLLIFVFGLIAPLTPSRGCPTASALAVFVAGPVLLLAWRARRGAGAGRAVLSLQAIVTAGAALWVLARIGCLA